MNVDDMLARVSSHQVSEWMAFSRLKAERDKEAMKKASEADEVVDPRA